MGSAADEQRRLKLERVADALRTEGIQVPELNWVAGSDRGYRNRLRLRIDDGQIAFFNPEKAADCVVLEPGLCDAIAELRTAADEMPQQLRGLSWVEVRGEDTRGRVSACFALQVEDARLGSSSSDSTAALTGSLEATRSALQARLGSRFLIGFLGESEPPMQRYASEGVDLVVALGAFLQVNHEINRALVRYVLGRAQQQGAKEFLDLYAGCGNFALPLAARGLSGTAVEASALSAGSMREGAKSAGLHDLSVIHSEVGAVLAELAAAPSAFVIADPPRAGLGEVAAGMAQLCSGTLLLVSCNPQSLARDLARLAPCFRLDSMRAFDMFPHTEHLELAAALRRRA